MTTKNGQAQSAPQNGPDMAGQIAKSVIAETEESVFNFWQKGETFQKSLDKNLPEKNPNSKGEFIFYDGPPFATGTPHMGHFLPSAMKDAVPRYKTMRGYCVPRKWGWDCHGLPIENLIQKENNLQTKKDIENFGIKKFSQAAKASVFRYDREWRKSINRIGRWVDMDNQYTTMDSNFMESVWWAFSELNKKGLVYEDFKVMHISPLLETPLSNFEVNQAYRDITDISAYVKFEIEAGQEIGEQTYLLAWTTTPWTLPGNVALAVGADIDYVTVEIGDDITPAAENQKGKYILAKALLEKVLKDKKYKILSEFKGGDLVGKMYKPIFDYYAKDQNLENRENGWKVYSADFVTTEDGTGIVHIAPAFGEDDLNLGKAKKLPFVQHVNIDGTIKTEATDFAGRQAKPKATESEPNKHQETDIEVIKYLAHHGTLFEKEKFIHSYPHCWRTDAPLLNYALSSWFVKVTDFKNKMVKLNEGVKWVPESIGAKRFGNWLENAKDWGISRSRFWGTTMPVWRAEDGTTEILGSVAEIKERTKGTNRYFLARHGQAEHNITKYLAADNSIKSDLTEQGIKDSREIGQTLIKILGSQKIDLIFCSPLSRARKTAEIVCEIINFDQKNIVIDNRLTETKVGVLNGKPNSGYWTLVKSSEGQFEFAPEGGETLPDIRKRVGDFIYETDSKYQDKNILIITHEYPIWMLTALKEGMNNKKAASIKIFDQYFVEPGYAEEYNFAKIPHDDDYVLDLHRPYIDEIIYQKEGKTFTRIPEVFDTWFDSGSMPYAVSHYPFEKTVDPVGGLFKKTKGFPADFIAEGLDQTRGWFYTLLALNTALFNKSPYKNVVVNGLLLAEDGRKMSKSLNNYPDPNYIINKYGADAMRYFLLASPLVKSESISFSEKSIDEIVKKVSNRLLNVVSFYELYVESETSQKYFNQRENSDKNSASTNILDLWIKSLLNQLIEKVTVAMEKYELDSAARPIADFVDDLSTWYLRRSRDRFKGENHEDVEAAAKTTFTILMTLAKIMAPFMPFLAEDVYQRVSGLEMSNLEKSVHLENWPIANKFDQKLLDQMKIIREFVVLGLEARDVAKIKVRQPLQTLKIKLENDAIELENSSYKNNLLDLIKDEVNVKEIMIDNNLDSKVWLDTNISPELAEEGIAREFIRFVQSLRKENNLNPDDKIILDVSVDQNGQKIIEKFMDTISKTVNAVKINFGELNNFYQSNNSGEQKDQELNTENISFKVSIQKNASHL